MLVVSFSLQSILGLGKSELAGFNLWQFREHDSTVRKQTDELMEVLPVLWKGGIISNPLWTMLMFQLFQSCLALPAQELHWVVQRMPVVIYLPGVGSVQGSHLKR